MRPTHTPRPHATAARQPTARQPTARQRTARQRTARQPSARTTLRAAFAAIGAALALSAVAVVAPASATAHHRSLDGRPATSGSHRANPGSRPAASATGPATSGSFPVTIDTPAGRITISNRPTRIISLSPTATEDLFAIGAGHQVIAVDDDSDYPASAPRTSLSGYTPNVEAIARYHPDLVVVASDPVLVSSLAKLTIPVLYEPPATDLAGAYGEILQLGRATGEVAQSGALVASMRARIRRLVAAAPHFAKPPSYFYELSANPYYSATSATFIGSVLGLFRLHDIANAAKDAGSGYPESFSEEYILEADPQIIFLADTGPGNGGQSPATVASRPAWSGIAAVADHDVIALNADIASRWGPRIVELIALVEKALWTYKHQSG